MDYLGTIWNIRAIWQSNRGTEKLGNRDTVEMGNGQLMKNVAPVNEIAKELSRTIKMGTT